MSKKNPYKKDIPGICTVCEKIAFFDSGGNGECFKRLATKNYSSILEENLIWNVPMNKSHFAVKIQPVYEVLKDCLERFSLPVLLSCPPDGNKHGIADPQIFAPLLFIPAHSPTTMTQTLLRASFTRFQPLRVPMTHARDLTGFRPEKNHAEMAKVWRKAEKYGEITQRIAIKIRRKFYKNTVKRQ